MPDNNPTPHGSGVRGLAYCPSSPLFEGRFGRIFRSLPEFSPKPTLAENEVLMRQLAEAMTAEHETHTVQQPDEIDGEENPSIPAGYTYFGQFIDHDLTFDPVSSLDKENDPDSLVNFRTPRFDLDCVYGRGPNDQPYMYEGSGKLLVGRNLTGSAFNPNAKDHQRSSNHRSIIGDPRNDENVIVSQIQGLFIRFHNRLVDSGLSFDQAQLLTRWHYQYVVLNDFLPRIVGNAMVESVLPHFKPLGNHTIFEQPPQLRFYEPKHNSFIPIEFSVAAYRFGHSMVRPDYRLNEDDLTSLEIFNFANPSLGLNGFGEFPSTWAIDWGKYFELEIRPLTGKARILPAYRIDCSLVNPLANLPKEHGMTPDMRNLTFRNLRRGLVMDLPSGQDVARAMGETPLHDDQIFIGKATDDPTERQTITAAVPDLPAGQCPLWTYILAEAAHNLIHANGDTKKNVMGPVGGRIIAETFIGLMLNDTHSFLSRDPNWNPSKATYLGHPNKTDYKMPDFVRFALGH